MLRAIAVASVTFILALALPASPAPALTVSAPYLVKDIIAEDSEGYGPTHMTGVGSTLFFVTGGKEQVLWKSDGTAAGTLPVTQVAGKYAFEDPASFGDLLVFEAEGGLWSSDGTETGTHLIAPIYPYGEDRWGTPPTILRSGTLFVAACGPNRTRCGLWRTDGTPEGTLLVKEAFGSEIASFRGGLIGSGGFWTSDGTPEGTQQFTASSLREIQVVGDDLMVFTKCGTHAKPCEIWRSDISDEGRFAIATAIERFDDDDYDDDHLYPIVVPSAAGDGTFVVCADAEVGGLWSSDGTAEGTRILGAGSCGPHTVKHKVGGVWVFNTYGSVWRSDGTPEGTRRLGPFGGGHVETLLGGTDEVVLFAVKAGIGSGTELWQSDGTAAGTFAVSPMPTVGWWQNSDDEERPATGTAGGTVFFCGCEAPSSTSVSCEAENGCQPWAVTISSPSTTTTSTSTTTTTSTGTPESTTSTTTTSTSTTSTTVACAFGSAALCDDADPCTVDICEAGRCQHQLRAGLAGVRCRLRHRAPSLSCKDLTPHRLQRRLERADRFVRRAAHASNQRKARRRIRQAMRQLEAAGMVLTKRVHRGLAAACAVRLERALAEARAAMSDWLATSRGD